jgi:phospho-N-acetylmuramoyl-pentapeptide-transferase
VLLITGMANFINITDGLDGLAAGLMIPLALSMIIACASPNNETSMMLLLATIGASLGFLWFNFSPAKVFMGDTGALALGALIPAVAIITKCEVIMVVAGMVFVLDGLSTVLQWAVFKFTRITTGTGKRVFKMSPFHHHLELSGWAEQLIVVRFWIIAWCFALLAFFLEAWYQ